MAQYNWPPRPDNLNYILLTTVQLIKYTHTHKTKNKKQTWLDCTTTSTIMKKALKANRKKDFSNHLCR